MDDNYLDNKFKEILGNPPKLEPTIAELEEMKTQLAAVPQVKGRKGLMGPLLWLLLPFALAFLYLFIENQNLRRDLSALDERLTSINQEQNSGQKEIVYHYDTIYRVFQQDDYVIQEISHGNFKARPNQNLLSLNLSGQYTFPTYPIDRNESTSLYELSQWLNTTDKDQSNTTLEERTAALDLGLLDPLSTKQFTLSPDHPYLIVDPNQAELPYEPPAQKQRFNPLANLNFKGLSTMFRFSPIHRVSHEIGGGANNLGLHFGINLRGGRQLEFGLEILDVNFETGDANQFARFPILPPNDPADQLHELYGNLRYLQIPISLRQYFQLKGRFQPSLSVGLVAHQPLRQKFTYEYLAPFEEYKLGTTFRDGDLAFNSIRFGAGLDFDLTKQLDLQSEVVFQNAFNTNSAEYFRLQYWSFRMGLAYNF